MKRITVGLLLASLVAGLTSVTMQAKCVSFSCKDKPLDISTSRCETRASSASRRSATI